MALQFKDNSPYFAKPLALKTLLGERAFSDLKKLMDPCCGIGIENICTAPCNSDNPDEMCPTLTITDINLNCNDCAENTITVVVDGMTSPVPLIGSVFATINILSLLGIPPIGIEMATFNFSTDGTYVLPISWICSGSVLGIGFSNILLPFRSLLTFIAFVPNGPASIGYRGDLIDVFCRSVDMCAGSKIGGALTSKGGGSSASTNPLGGLFPEPPAPITVCGQTVDDCGELICCDPTDKRLYFYFTAQSTPTPYSGESVQPQYRECLAGSPCTSWGPWTDLGPPIAFVDAVQSGWEYVDVTALPTATPMELRLIVAGDPTVISVQTTSFQIPVDLCT